MDEFGKRLRSFGNKALSNNNGDGNENVKKATGILSKTTTRVSYFFLYISLPSLHDYDEKMPNFTFHGGLTQGTTNFTSPL